MDVFCDTKCVVGFTEIAACSRISGQNTKFLIILSTTTGENRFPLVLLIRSSSILTFFAYTVYTAPSSNREESKSD